MELNTYKIRESVLLDHIRTDRFKKARFTVTFTLPADNENYAKAVLFLPTAMRATQKYPSFATLCRRCDELYAADIADMNSLRSGVCLVGLRAAMLGNEYINEDDRIAGFDVLDGVMEAMSQILLCPLLRDSDLETEKLNLINRINAQMNDPFTFGLRRLREIIMKDIQGVITADKAKEQAKKTDCRMLREFFETVLKRSKLEFFYCGSESAERVRALIEKHFSELLCEKKRADIPKIPQRQAQNIVVNESGAYGQSHLLMAFRSGTVLDDGDFYATELMNEIYGEGPISKLFLNVREKRSLCYFCGSGYDETNGIITVGCGINSRDREEAKAEILCQLDEIRKGNISDAELEAAKQSIFSDCREAEDHPEDYEEFSRMARLFGGPSTIKEYRDGVAKVTKEQISRAAMKTQLDAVYFLRGELEEDMSDE